MKISLYLLFFFLTFQLLAQDSTVIEQSILKLKGQQRIEKYIEVIADQTTRSPQFAIKLAQQALAEKGIKGESALYAKLLYHLGDLYFLTGDYNKALSFLQQAETKLTQLNDKTVLPMVYISIGRLYKKAHNDCSNTKKYYHKAEAIYKATNNLKELATVHNYLGNITESCDKDLNKALSYYYQSEQYYITHKDTIGWSYSLDFISQVMAQQNNNKDAIARQTKALELRLAIKDSFAIAISYTNLGEIFMMQQQPDFAKENFKKAYAISGKSDYKDLNIYLLGKLADISKEQNDYQSAYFYLGEQTALKDKLLDAEKHKQLAEMKTKYETEKKEAALNQEQIKNKNKTLWVILLIGAVVVLCIVVVLVVLSKKLERQKAELTILQNLDAERNRIARDLHDNLGAELTLISSKLDIKSYKATNEVEKEELSAIRAISSNANFMLRETIWSIHKQELTVDELYQKTKDYAQRIFEDKETQVIVEVEQKEAALSPSVALHLYRILQETINNASKYANCKTLTLHIAPHLVVVQDDGQGFDETIVSKGYGLQNIKQRVEELNGIINFHSEIGKGTSIEIKF